MPIITHWYSGLQLLTRKLIQWWHYDWYYSTWQYFSFWFCYILPFAFVCHFTVLSMQHYTHSYAFCTHCPITTTPLVLLIYLFICWYPLSFHCYLLLCSITFIYITTPHSGGPRCCSAIDYIYYILIAYIIDIIALPVYLFRLCTLHGLVCLWFTLRLDYYLHLWVCCIWTHGLLRCLVPSVPHCFVVVYLLCGRCRYRYWVGYAVWYVPRSLRYVFYSNLRLLCCYAVLHLPVPALLCCYTFYRTFVTFWLITVHHPIAAPRSTLNTHLYCYLITLLRCTLLCTFCNFKLLAAATFSHFLYRLFDSLWWYTLLPVVCHVPHCCVTSHHFRPHYNTDHLDTTTWSSDICSLITALHSTLFTFSCWWLEVLLWPSLPMLLFPYTYNSTLRWCIYFSCLRWMLLLRILFLRLNFGLLFTPIDRCTFDCGCCTFVPTRFVLLSPFVTSLHCHVAHCSRPAHCSVYTICYYCSILFCYWPLLKYSVHILILFYYGVTAAGSDENMAWKKPIAMSLNNILVILFCGGPCYGSVVTQRLFGSSTRAFVTPAVAVTFSHHFPLSPVVMR